MIIRHPFQNIVYYAQRDKMSHEQRCYGTRTFYRLQPARHPNGQIIPRDLTTIAHRYIFISLYSSFVYHTTNHYKYNHHICTNSNRKYNFFTTKTQNHSDTQNIWTRHHNRRIPFDIYLSPMISRTTRTCPYQQDQPTKYVGIYRILHNICDTHHHDIPKSIQKNCTNIAYRISVFCCRCLWRMAHWDQHIDLILYHFSIRRRVYEIFSRQ